MPPSPTMEAVLAPKQRMLRSGHGEPVLYLHGAGGFSGWLPIFEKLAADYQLIVPEHPNFGASADAPLLRNVSDYAYYYLDFIEALGFPKIHLVGHSLGGWISAELAVRDCSRLASLTLLAPAGVRVKGLPPGDNFIWNPQEAVRTLFHDPKLAEQILSITPTEEQQAEAIRTRYIAARLGWEPRWYNPSLGKWLHRIKTPTLLMWGDDDKLLPPGWAKAWKEGVPKLRHVKVAQCGHSPHVEQSEAVLKEMRSFLKEYGA
jgi:pimeloyl-ACP methyl ester carboxylesterase